MTLYSSEISVFLSYKIYFAAWDDPYLLGIVHDSLEVYTLDNCTRIQTLRELNKARLLCRSKQGKVFLASTSQVWSINATDFSQQIKILLEQCQFQLALKLTVTKNCFIHQYYVSNNSNY